jgi:cell division septation protein DedD
LAHQTQDDGFHEIQLNGKQLVFLFMAATVVSVVIFLCGVLVGRGVRSERTAGPDQAANAATDVVPDAAAAAPAATPAEADPTKAAPPPDVDDLSYFNRLEQANAPAEKLKTADAPHDSANASAARAVPSKPAPAVAKDAAAKDKDMPKAAAASAAPAGGGYAVQVAALNVRSEADAIAKRLAGKGYAAYVVDPPAGTPAVFRVRVGRFKTRREAETVAAKLKKEEQFSPWITR